MTPYSKSRKLFFLAFILYSAFVIYGSLVPLNLRLISLGEALNLFLELRFVDLGNVSRMDWATNVVLGIPISFLGLCWIPVSGHPVQLGGRIVLLLFFCLTVSITAEFLQIFFSSRVPSINDIVAQFIGSVVGVILGIFWGNSLRGAIDEFLATQVLDKKVGFLFSAYVLTIVILNVMPLDLSLSPVEIYRKWDQGYINLIPFAFKGDTSTLIYNTVVDTSKWVPVPLFFIYLRGGKIYTAILFSLSIACSIEFAQLFVMSRITDVTDVFTALAGSTIGGWLAWKIKNHKSDPVPIVKHERTRLGRVAVIFGIWMCIPLIIDWFPFDFTFDKPAIKRHLSELSWIPFINYQATNFLHAIATAVRKTIVFAVPGMIFAYAVRNNARQYSRQMNIAIVIIATMFITGWAGIIEIGQFFLPGDVPDLTDIFLSVFGFLAGFLVLKPVFRSLNN